MRLALTLAIEILFMLVFLRALVSYLRTRDPLSRDVMLVFLGVAGLLVLEVSGRLFGEAPLALRNVGVLLLLAQPYFTLRLVARLRAVPLWLLWGALAGYALTAGPLVFVERPAPLPLSLAAVGVFLCTEAVAAGYLLAEARRRTGSPRVRLASAGLASALLAAALFVLGATAAADPQSTAVEAAANAARVVGLLSGLGYLVAFVPPASLRGFWGAAAAREHSRALLAAPADEPVASLWRRLAGSAVAVTGCDAVAVLTREPDGTAQVLAHVGLPAGRARALPAATLDDLLDAHHAGTARVVRHPQHDELTEGTGARFVTVLPVHARQGVAAVVLLSRYRSLFDADDVRLLSDLTTQTVLLTERRAVLTEQERLAAELAATVQALRAANEAKTAFLAGMSHELRTPLNAVIGFSDLMVAQQDEDGTCSVPADWVGHVNRSGRHLLALINDLLDLAKVEAGRLELQREDLDLPTLAGEVVAELRPLADRRGLALTADVPPCTLVGDRLRVRQVLYNLLSNALKFTPEGGVRLDVHPRAHEVTVVVTDTGVGIAPEDQGRVFEEFRQVGDAAAQQSGTGLGLALTRRLVEAHGGHVALTSTPGEGTRVSVHLPVDPAHALPAPPAGALGADAPAPVAPGAAVPVGAPTVLVLEDDGPAANLLRRYLTDAGYDVRVLADGESGLADARARRPAAVVLDILLPSADGWEVLRRLKSDEALRDVPVIIVSVVDEREVGLALGAEDYFVKPVEPEALLQCLARCVPVSPGKRESPRVLVVDDDAATRELVKTTLHGEGYVVLTAPGGQAALDTARTEPVDVVVCDLLMPDLNGFEVVAGLRALPATRETPIVILTGQSLSEADKRRLSGDILGVLHKGEDAQQGLREWLARAVPAPEGRGLATDGPAAPDRGSPERTAPTRERA